MKVGDVVIPTVGVLACGSGLYTHAVVASVRPFVLVSEEGDMMWRATVKPNDFMVLCQVHPAILKTVMKRFAQENA